MQKPVPFTLIPSDLVAPTRKLTPPEVVSVLNTALMDVNHGGVVAKELVINQTVEIMQDHKGQRVPVTDVEAWGVLELSCNLTHRSVCFLMPVAENMTVQAINQSSVVGSIGNTLSDNIIYRGVAEYTTAGILLFSDGEFITFSKRYATLRLAMPNEEGGLDDVHVFYRGEGLQTLLEVMGGEADAREEVAGG